MVYIAMLCNYGVRRALSFTPSHWDYKIDCAKILRCVQGYGRVCVACAIWSMEIMFGIPLLQNVMVYACAVIMHMGPKLQGIKFLDVFDARCKASGVLSIRPRLAVNKNKVVHLKFL